MKKIERYQEKVQPKYTLHLVTMAIY